MFLNLTLPRQTRRGLTILARKTRDADLRVRARILLKIHEGKSGNQAAKELGCAPSTTSRIVARFQAEGIACLWDRRAHNGGRLVDGRVRAGIWEILQDTADVYGFSRPTWTLEALRSVIAEKLEVLLSVGHLWKVLRSMRIRLGQPKPYVSCPWPAAKRRRRLRWLRRLYQQTGGREVVVFVDEVDIHLNPRIGRDWMLPGQQRWIRTPGKNEKRYLAGAYDPKRNRMVYVEGDQKASWLFLNLLRALEEAYPWATVIHVILDNFIIHKSNQVQLLLSRISSKVRLHFLPPYCPDDNRIERIWKDLHDNVTRCHRCPDMRSLMAAVRSWLGRRFQIHRGPCYGV
jgi:transposase